MSGARPQVIPTCPDAPPYEAGRVDRFFNYQRGYLLEDVGPQLAMPVAQFGPPNRDQDAPPNERGAGAGYADLSRRTAL